MNTYKFVLIVYWSAEDAAFEIDVPELPDVRWNRERRYESVAMGASTVIRTVGVDARHVTRYIPA